MYLAASIPPREPGPRPSSRSSARYLTWARNLLSSIREEADSASVASLSSARFSDIILSKAGRGVEATLLRPRARLEALRRLLPRELFFAPPFFCALVFARLCAADPSIGQASGQTNPK